MDIVIPVLVLAVIVGIAAFGFVTIRRRNPAADTDSTDNAIPKTDTDDNRPLGDTDEAHDEINPHDLPLSHPGREEAEEVAGGADGTTRGPLP
jgi:hypothetical protein